MGELKVSNKICKKISAPYAYKKSTIFVSYSSEDSIIAGALKRNLERYGISVFLAHEDIKPGRDWADDLEKTLEGCTAILPIISRNFIKSEWASQEIGFAYARKKFILSLKVDKDINPGGFIARSQALPINIDKLETSCQKIIDVFGKYRLLREPLIDSLIYALEQVPTYAGFETANELFEVLKKVKNLTKQQLNQIVKIALKNHQVRECSEGREYIASIMSKDTMNIDSDLREVYQQLKDTYDVLAVENI